MSGPIQVIPPGMLGFFQLKNFGRNPVDLPEVLNAQIDLFRWYMQARAEIMPVASRAVAAGVLGYIAFTTNPLSVDQDEFWYVVEFKVHALLATGDTLQFSAAWADLNNTVSLVPDSTTPQPLLAGPAAGNRVGRSNTGNFFVPGGGTLGVHIEANEGAGVTFTGHARIVRLPV